MDELWDIVERISKSRHRIGKTIFKLWFDYEKIAVKKESSNKKIKKRDVGKIIRDFKIELIKLKMSLDNTFNKLDDEVREIARK